MSPKEESELWARLVLKLRTAWILPIFVSVGDNGKLIAYSSKGKAFKMVDLGDKIWINQLKYNNRKSL